ncbi:DUF5689 domain-containing protein [Alistipes sp. ZOR0009]|uniref:DUF5689 domain-containing protein n=1 Tax=Alistipes sp. ZOR0009 TaxID=1339253 RepID=UPI000647AA5D|nr:DUF5689 domain-containing protein [Alistipes sp. ZOR0009]
MKRFLYTLLGIGLLAGVVGCSPEFDTPEYKESQYTGAATMTIKAFKERFTNKAPVEIKENIVLRGVVNASDSCGNVYKKIYFQDLEGTAGLELVVDGSSLYKICNVGQEIFVECKGLYVGNYDGYTAIGTPFTKSNGDVTIGRMPLFLAKEHIFKQGRRDVSKVKVQTINSLTELTPDMVDRVITIKNIYFPGGGKDLFADKSSQYPTSRDIADLKGGRSLVYTSSYATFSQKTLPKGMGSITCVATKYGSTWQLLIRDYNDVGTFDGTDVDPNVSIIVTSLNESFNAGASNGSAAINGWCTFSTIGDRNWLTMVFDQDQNHYAQASAHKGAAPDYEYWLVTPGLDLDKATQKLISFETAMNYWMNTSSLEVYLMNDKDPSKATVKELLNARIAIATDPVNTWIPTGSIDLSSKSGVVYVGFRYRAKGGASNSTTFRVDNFKFGSEVAK